MFIQLYLITLPIFFAIDMIWLGVIARGLYQKQIGFLMAPSVNWAAALLFYFLFIGGLVYFVIQPAIEVRSWSQALYSGLLFGLVTYATYDLTNLATVKNWPLLVTIIDLIWGSVLASSVSLLSYFVAKKIGL